MAGDGGGDGRSGEDNFVFCLGFLFLVGGCPGRKWEDTHGVDMLRKPVHRGNESGRNEVREETEIRTL